MPPKMSPRPSSFHSPRLPPSRSVLVHPRHQSPKSLQLAVYRPAARCHVVGPSTWVSCRSSTPHTRHHVTMHSLSGRARLRVSSNEAVWLPWRAWVRGEGVFRTCLSHIWPFRVFLRSRLGCREGLQHTMRQGQYERGRVMMPFPAV